mgnify:CR=1 FL=1
MLLFEAKKQRQGVLFDVFYSDVLQDSDTDAEYGLPYKAALKNSMVTASYTYEVYSSKNAIINIVGGFAIAKFQLGWDAADAMKTFMLLSIGDGLVSQLPAFLVAIASGLIVARAGGGKTVGEVSRELGLTETAVRR